MGRDPEAPGLTRVSPARRLVPDRLPPLPLPDLSGRRAVVTGASAGIGLATAMALAGAGATVVLGVRNPGRGDAAAHTIRAAHPGADLAVEQVELGSLASIAAFAGRVGAGPVHLLVNNAGLSTPDSDARTVDGFELRVGVNYLGSWALTAALWPVLVAAGGARVVTLGSLMASRGRIGPDFGTGEAAGRAYGDSKLAQVVFAGELGRRSRAAGTDVTAVAAHPGWSQTAIFDAAGTPLVFETFGRLLGALQSPADGAQPVLRAATDPHPAAYYGPTRRWGSVGPVGAVELPARARQPGVGDRLWEISTRLTGVPLEP